MALPSSEQTYNSFSPLFRNLINACVARSASMVSEMFDSCTDEEVLNGMTLTSVYLNSISTLALELDPEGGNVELVTDAMKIALRYAVTHNVSFTA